ncbi:hypothetical protein M011DRAFT_162444 [Sporormia fimetaria CBS 119925]|uniref:Zn(2)-C6 fungal-type domain-containing protein n=1 Tax=Sporormia fimetaria CBS 119925 TaxID=1340428 RepID=A0A6A6V5M3_9PLEO|nr:hypothetical protein M011DRAFT_162444 [Sporormia fimetaria CBS 119925]
MAPGKPGCFECRKRRIRCDKTIPECNSCLRRGSRCPGYPRVRPPNLHTSKEDPVLGQPAIIKGEDRHFSIAHQERHTINGRTLSQSQPVDEPLSAISMQSLSIARQDVKEQGDKRVEVNVLPQEGKSDFDMQCNIATLSLTSVETNQQLKTTQQGEPTPSCFGGLGSPETFSTASKPDGTPQHVQGTSDPDSAFELWAFSKLSKPKGSNSRLILDLDCGLPRALGCLTHEARKSTQHIMIKIRDSS